MPLRHSKNHDDNTHHRRFSSISNKLTGFRRPHQTLPTSQHGTAQVLFKEPSATLERPHHYHSLNPTSQQRQQQQTMSTTRQHPSAPRVHFAGSPNPPVSSYHQHQYSRDRASSQSSSTSSHAAISSNTTSTTGNLHSNPVSVASSRSSFDLEPSAPIAEWCHQMHILQSRRYDWCVGCFPRPVLVKDEEYAALQREEELQQQQQEVKRVTFSTGHQAWEEEELQRRDQEAHDYYVRRERMVQRVRESRSAAHAYQ